MAGRPLKYGPEERARIHKLYDETRNASEVARIVGCSPATVRCEVSPEYREHVREVNRAASRARYIPTERHTAELAVRECDATHPAVWIKRRR